MAFTQDTFATVGAQASNPPTVYSYDTDDNIVEITSTGYFADKQQQLNQGDIIFCRVMEIFQILVVKDDTSTAELVDLGGSGASDNHFISEAERDTYFQANTDLLVTGLPIVVKTDDEQISFFLWAGETDPSVYINTSWQLASAIFPTGSIDFGGRERVGAAGLGLLGVEDKPTNQFFHTTATAWDDTGSTRPFCAILGPVQVLLPAVGTDDSPIQSTFEWSIDTTGILTEIVNVKDGSVEFVIAPDRYRSRIWEGTDKTKDPISDIIFDVPGTGFYRFGPAGADRQFFKPNTIYSIQYDGLSNNNAPQNFQVKGQDVGGTFFPATENRGSVVTLHTLAYQTDLYYNSVSANNQISRSSTSFTDALQKNFIVAEDGDYELGVMYQWRHAEKDVLHRVQIRVDGVENTDLRARQYMGGDQGDSDTRMMTHAVTEVALTAGTYDIDMQYSTDESGKKAYLYYRRLYLRKIDKQL